VRSLDSLVTEVIVVGGGPVGLTTALELARRGVDVTVIEHRVEVSDRRPRAKTTSMRTMEHFRRLGVAKAIRDAAAVPVAWSQDVVFCTGLFDEDDELYRFRGAFGLTMERRDEAAESGQQIAQYLVERTLRQAVDADPHVELRLGWRFQSLRQTHDAIFATAETGSGERTELAGQYLVGCDGARSKVRDALRIRMRGRSGGRPNLNFIIEAPDLANAVRIEPAVQYWVLRPEFQGIVGPLDLNAGRWWLMVNNVEPGSDRDDPGRIQRELIGEQWISPVLATDPWVAEMRQAERLRVGRAFIAGDSAHLNPPWGGHGFNTGVGDAVDIGWKLAADLAGWAGPALLDSYEVERGPVHQMVIDQAEENMRTLGVDLIDHVKVDSPEDRARAADHIERAKAQEFMALDLVLGVSYERSTFVWHDTPIQRLPADGVPTSATVGYRLPHRWCATGESIFDGLGPWFTLLVLEGPAEGCGLERLASAARDLGMPLKVMRPEFGGQPNQHTARLVLVRPDQHVSWIGDAVPEDAVGVLRRVTGFEAICGRR
jgi:2-polyprenyl-6-methoxyphenol hydroxylase-like FAD-dependent oxidoreductase